ncbi:5970_t:CDS:10, partial [Diversispora eburnea]
MAEPSPDPIRQLIINSLFSDITEDSNSGVHGVSNESLITYLKVAEDVSGTGASPTADRPGTIVRRNGKIRIHKAKRNANNTFSIGKTWPLEDIKCIEVLDSQAFILTMNKSYFWTADKQREKKRRIKNKSTTNLRNVVHAVQNMVGVQKNLRANHTFSPSTNASIGSVVGAVSSTAAVTAGGGVNIVNGVSVTSSMSVSDGAIGISGISELLNDFDWKGSGNAAALEERLLNELAALEAANIHAIVESDDRIHSLIGQIDKAIAELDNMDQWLSLYTAELNTMGDDDIHHIESQNRGLQVQTANQKALLSELDRLMQSITLPDHIIQILIHESMDTPQGVQNIEQAAIQLKNVLETPFDDATREMKVVQEKLELYKFHCTNFCSRLYEYMTSIFQYQAETLMNDKSRGARHNNLTIQSHEHITESLHKYQGLSKWMKEMDPKRHLEIQSIYVTSKEKVYKKETKDYLQQMRQMLAKRELSGENTYAFSDAALAHTHRTSLNYGNWLSFDNAKPSWEVKDGGGKFPPEESFDHCLQTIIPLVANEQNFISSFFHLSKKGSKLVSPEEAFIKDLDAEEDSNDLNSHKLPEHMEKLFGFLPDELSIFVSYGCKHDTVQVVGMIVSLEKHMQEYEKRGQDQVVRILQNVRKNCLEIFERFINDQLRAIEDTKVTSKKRKGIVIFIRIFPRFVERIEHSMKSADLLEIRRTVNRGYERIVKTMFESLDAIAKDADEFLPTSADDKEQLNAHIITLENMHHFYSEIRTRKIMALEPFMRSARSSYDKHLEAYAKSVIRKPFGIESLLRTTAAPEEVGFRLQYNKVALKKIVSSYPGKEIKKGLESLYKRVDKHFTEEEGLLQVVWRSIEEE